MPRSRDDDLDVLREENLLLREENERLRGQLGMDARQPDALPGTPEADGAAVVPITATSPSEAKVALFLSLFRGREDVHAKRWESKAGATLVSVLTFLESPVAVVDRGGGLSANT